MFSKSSPRGSKGAARMGSHCFLLNANLASQTTHSMNNSSSLKVGAQLTAPALSGNFPQGSYADCAKHLDLPKMCNVLWCLWSLSLLSSVPLKVLSSRVSLANPYAYQRLSETFFFFKPSLISRIDPLELSKSMQE